MNYEDVEITEHDSKQTYCYWFVGPNYEYKWTNAPVFVTGTLDGDTLDFFHPRGGISHTEATESQDAGRTGLDIKVSHKNPIILKHKSFPPPGDTDVTIYRQNELDGELYQIWSGVITETPIEGSDGIIKCQTVTELIAGSEGLTETRGPTCPYFLGFAPCPVLLSAITDAVTVEEIDTDNFTVTVSGSIRITGKYKLGVLEAPDDDKRTILDDTVDGSNHVLTLSQNFPATTLRVGDPVSAVLGCNRLFSTCIVDFGVWTGDGAAFGGNPIQANKNIHQIGRLE